MQFGVQFFPAVYPDETPAAQYFRESLAIGDEAEKLGFTHTRIVEHYFHPYGGYSPNPILFLSALSQRTTTMRLLTGAVLPVFNHPLKLAGEIGMIDAISNGRIDVGFARAFLPHEFRRFGISPDESYARFEEGVEQIDLLLREENATHRGRFHSFEDTTSLPRPTQKPRPKFYIAATTTPETFAYAGRLGYSLMAIPLGLKLRDNIKVYRDAWREAGHPGEGEIMVAFHMFCHEDAKFAREIPRKSLDDYFRLIFEASQDWTMGTSSKDYKGYDQLVSKLKGMSLESQIETGSAWIGTPDEIKAIVERVIAFYGEFEHASLQVNFGTIPYEEARSSMRLFAREVMPAFSRMPERVG
ncbi:MAG: LLM class flavin-dependent oxidoreductase [Rhizobiales bacterium]|nr:LLM class flavin-dependent oxidoreductase [Hyphomicrobiales bacterium]